MGASLQRFPRAALDRLFEELALKKRKCSEKDASIENPAHHIISASALIK
jgi:hypothetical protein